MQILHTGLVRGVRILVSALAAVVTASPVAAAAGDYAYVVGLSADRTVLTPEHPSTRITISAGIFGSAALNAGPCNFIGDVVIGIGSGVGTLSAASVNTAAAPFSNGPIPEVVSNEKGELTITGIDVFRGLNAALPPPPGFGPAAHGANTLVPVYSFQLTLSDLSEQTINVSVNGQGCRIVEWQYQESVAAWVPFGTTALDADAASLDLSVAPLCADWFDGFGSPGHGINGPVYAMTSFDDGTGPRLVIGGNFTAAGTTPARGIARWNGAGWSPMGFGLGTVTALAVFNDGTGEHLYAAGQFGTVNNEVLNRIAKWNGSTWEPLGTGLDNGAWCMKAYDDGSGTELFVAGDFTAADGAATDHIASWNGERWRTWNGGPSMRSEVGLAYDAANQGVVLFGGLGNGTESDTWVRDADGWSRPASSGAGTRYGAMMTYDSLRNRVVMYGSRGGSHPTTLAFWDGSTWTAFPDPFTNPPRRFFSQIVYDAARDRVVLFGGTHEGTFLNDTWEFDGTDWTQIVTANAPSTRTRHAMAYDAQRQRVVLFGGQNLAIGDTRDTWEYDGVDWVQVATTGPAARSAHAMTYDSLRQRVVMCGGQGQSPFQDTWSWNGTAWVRIDVGLPSFPTRYLAPMVYDESADRIVQRVGSQTLLFDGSSWSVAAEGGPNGTVYDLETFAFEGEEHLYAGGVFSAAGGAVAGNVARWDGGRWFALAGGTQGPVNALCAFNGSLYVGGGFSNVGNISASNIARWSGSAWSPLGFGVDNPVHGLDVVDLGGGQALYTLGTFTRAGTTNTIGIARWSGAVWSAVSNGLSPGATGRTAIRMTDAGTPVMYVGGTFLSAGGHPSRNVAKWGGQCEPPSIITQPDDLTALFGSSADFSVVATGQAPLAYQWRRDGNPLIPSPRIVGVNTPNLSIQAWSYSDAGVYDVVITNPNGSITSEGATFTVPLAGVVGPVVAERVIFPPEPVPAEQGGGTITALFSPVISSTGEVTVLGIIDGFRTIDQWDAGELTVEHRARDQAPGLPEGNLFVGPNLGSAFGEYVAGANGGLCFTSDLEGPDVTGPGDRTAMWFRDSGVSSLVAREGAPAPGAEPLVYFLNMRTGAVNTSGLVAFGSILSDPAGGPGIGSGVWTWDGESGTVLVTRTGLAAPDTTGTLTYVGQRVRVNDARDVLFHGRKDTTTGFNYSSVTDSALWVARDGAFRIAVKSGDPAPGFDPGVNIEAISDADMFLSASGEVTFTCYVAGPDSFRRRAVYRADNSGLTLLAADAHPAPEAGMGATIANATIVASNDHRQAVLYSQILHPPEHPSGPNWGYWFVDGAKLIPLILSDAGHLVGSPSGMAFSGVSSVALNNLGHVLLGCELYNGSTYNAIYGWAADFELFPVVVPGTQLSAVPGSYLTATNAFLSSEVGGISGPTSTSLNNAGNLVFQTNFTGGSNGVFVGQFTDFLGGFINCPTILEQPSPVTVRQGDPLQLFATVAGAAPLTHRWRRGDTLLSDGGAVSGAATPALSISPADITDAGVYTLEVSNACGSDTTEAVAVAVLCRADWDSSGTVNSQDFFDFLAAFFVLSPEADMNRDGSVNSQDFFDFLTAFFSGC